MCEYVCVSFELGEKEVVQMMSNSLKVKRENKLERHRISKVLRADFPTSLLSFQRFAEFFVSVCVFESNKRKKESLQRLFKNKPLTF